MLLNIDNLTKKNFISVIFFIFLRLAYLRKSQKITPFGKIFPMCMCRYGARFGTKYILENSITDMC